MSNALCEIQILQNTQNFTNCFFKDSQAKTNIWQHLGKNKWIFSGTSSYRHLHVNCEGDPHKIKLSQIGILELEPNSQGWKYYHHRTTRNWSTNNHYSYSIISF